MRKILFLALTLFTVVSAVLTVPKAEADVCGYSCGPCGMVCLCQVCVGAKPQCPCLQ